MFLAELLYSGQRILRCTGYMLFHNHPFERESPGGGLNRFGELKDTSHQIRRFHYAFRSHVVRDGKCHAAAQDTKGVISDIHETFTFNNALV